MTGRFDAVFLDAGGVLVSPHAASVAEHLAAEGFPVERERLLAAHYHGMHAVDRDGSDPEVFDAYHRAYVAHLGVPDAGAAAATTALDALWLRGGLWHEPLPGAADALARLASTGVRLAVVSNADGTVAELLARSGLVQVGPGPGTEVAAIVDSGAVGVAKPDPRIFEIALEAVGAAPERTLHVGDSYQYDVRGARAAGVRPVLVDPLGIRDDVDCHRVRGLGEVADLLV